MGAGRSFLVFDVEDIAGGLRRPVCVYRGEDERHQSWDHAANRGGFVLALEPGEEPAAYDPAAAGTVCYVADGLDPVEVLEAVRPASFASVCVAGRVLAAMREVQGGEVVSSLLSMEREERHRKYRWLSDLDYALARVSEMYREGESDV